MTERLPENPAQRKLLVVLDEADYELCQYDEEGRKLLLNPEVNVQQFPVTSDDQTLLSLQREGLLRPGARLLQSPYDGQLYVDIADAEDSFAVQKYTLFSSVCMFLGATKVQVTRIMCRDRDGTVEVNIGGDRMGVQADGRVQHERVEKLRTKISLCDEFEGGEADVEAAGTLMRTAGLMSNPNLRSLLEMAKVSNNRIKSREFQLDLTRETKSRLELALSVGIPGVARGSGDADIRSRENVEYQVSVRVDF